MIEEKNILWRNYLWPFKSSLYLYIFILFVFTFLLVFNQSVYSTEKKSIEKIPQKQNITNSSNCSYFNSYKNSNPKNKLPNSDEDKSADENEVSEDSDNISSYSACLITNYTFKITVGLNHFLFQLKQTFYNRCKIALFVLHHSWKSFLQ